MKRLFKFLVCLSAVTGCAKEEIVESSGVAGITEITVSLPQTKVAVDENSGKCVWSDGDKIAVWDKSAKHFVEFVLSSGSGEESGVFTSETPVSAIEGAEVIYPSAYACVISDKGEAVVDLPNVNALVKDGTVPVVMRGKLSLSDGQPSAGFSHINGVLKLTLSDVPAYAAGVVLKSDAQNLAGESVDGVIASGYSSKSLKVSFPYKTGYDSSVPVFFSLPAGAYSDLQVYLVDGDGDIIEGTQKNIKSAALKAGQYVIMPEWKLNRDNLRKDYIKVCGVKWAKGNLVRDASNAWHQKETGIDDSFQEGWGLHDEQWKYINWDNTISTSGASDVRYTYDNASFFDVFAWGGIGRQASYRSGRLVPVTANYDISCKVFWGYVNEKNPDGTGKSNPANLTELTGEARFSSTEDKNGNSIYNLNGTNGNLAGDVAFWASKGKYCMPKKALLSALSHPSESKASFQYGKYVNDGHTIYGYLYTTPNGEIVRSNKEVTFTDADLESGLFLPVAGRRGNTSNNVVIQQGKHAIYRSSTFGNPAHETHGEAHSQCATSLWFEGSNLPKYGFTSGKSTDDDGYSSDCTLSNAAGGCIRPILVDQTSVSGDVKPLERGPFDAVVGMPLPAWEAGCLDIHAINSGRGECTFLIMPDGTTLCVDAGEIAPDGGDHPRVDPKPNKDVRAYKVYAEYIKRCLPQGQTSMDYMLVTHFHGDHVGTFTGYRDTYHEANEHILTGVTALYEEVPYDKVIDRINPDYDQITATGTNVTSGLAHYKNFVNWAKRTKGMKAEKSAVGSADQLVMVRKPKAYPDFKIQINAANGEYWNGTSAVDLFSGIPDENSNSISFLLSYGDFDYLSSGDAGTQNAVGRALITAVNKPVEAMKAHHHFSWNTMSAAMMKVYKPKVVVSQSFYDHQPDMGHDWLCEGEEYSSDSNQEFQKAWNAYSSDKYWYFTNVHPKTAEVYPYEVAKMRSRNGHVVIRVKEGGSEFYVYVLDDTDFEYRVKQIDGPFSCHQ